MMRYTKGDVTVKEEASCCLHSVFPPCQVVTGAFGLLPPNALCHGLKVYGGTQAVSAVSLGSMHFSFLSQKLLLKLVSENTAKSKRGSTDYLFEKLKAIFHI